MLVIRCQVRQQHRLRSQLVAMLVLVVRVVVVVGADNVLAVYGRGCGGRWFVGGWEVTQDGCPLLDVLVLVHNQWVDVVHQRLPEGRHVLVFVVQLLLVVVGSGESLPAECIDE